MWLLVMTWVMVLQLMMMRARGSDGAGDDVGDGTGDVDDVDDADS